MTGPLALLLVALSFGFENWSAFAGAPLAPFLFSGLGYKFPLLGIFAIAYYFVAWTADEAPRGSRIAILILSGPFFLLYLLLAEFSSDYSWLVRLPFILYLVIVPAVVAIQIRAQPEVGEQDVA